MDTLRQMRDIDAVTLAQNPSFQDTYGRTGANVATNVAKATAGFVSQVGRFVIDVQNRRLDLGIANKRNLLLEESAKKKKDPAYVPTYTEADLNRDLYEMYSTKKKLSMASLNAEAFSNADMEMSRLQSMMNDPKYDDMTPEEREAEGLIDMPEQALSPEDDQIVEGLISLNAQVEDEVDKYYNEQVSTWMNTKTGIYDDLSIAYPFMEQFDRSEIFSNILDDNRVLSRWIKTASLDDINRALVSTEQYDSLSAKTKSYIIDYKNKVETKNLLARAERSYNTPGLAGMAERNTIKRGLVNMKSSTGLTAQDVIEIKKAIEIIDRENYKQRRAFKRV